MKAEMNRSSKSKTLWQTIIGNLNNQESEEIKQDDQV